jgi:hypothetical protein
VSLHPPKSNSLSGARTTEESVMVVRVYTEENPYFNEKPWMDHVSIHGCGSSIVVVVKNVLKHNTNQ